MKSEELDPYRRPRPKKYRKNPLGSGFGFGVITGLGVLGAAWAATVYFAKKNAPAGCNLCLEAANGATVPPNVTGAVTSTYRGFNYSTYFIDADTTLAWGWCLDGNGHHMSSWGFASQTLADAAAKKAIDGL